jgi:hypothetical protein
MTRKKILIACEFSGVVRRAFREKGHLAWSCDLLGAEDNHWAHFRYDALEVAYNRKHNWDMMIAFPPCTYLAVSGARWWKERSKEQEDALEFVRGLLNAPIEQIALENPIGKISSAIRKPDQIIQPWMFGHGETKATCLWLKNLSKLVPTDVVEGREQRIWKMPPSPNRSRERSRTYSGIGKAMAEQWGV